VVADGGFKRGNDDRRDAGSSTVPVQQFGAASKRSVISRSTVQWDLVADNLSLASIHMSKTALYM